MSKPEVVFDFFLTNEQASPYERYIYKARVVVWDDDTWCLLENNSCFYKCDISQIQNSAHVKPINKECDRCTYAEYIRKQILNGNIGNYKEKKLETTKGEKIMDSLKKYLDKHSEKLFTVVLVVLLDHFFLGGALRGRLEKMVEGLVTKVEKQISEE